MLNVFIVIVSTLSLSLLMSSVEWLIHIRMVSLLIVDVFTMMNVFPYDQSVVSSSIGVDISDPILCILLENRSMTFCVSHRWIYWIHHLLSSAAIRSRYCTDHKVLINKQTLLWMWNNDWTRADRVEKGMLQIATMNSFRTTRQLVALFV
jgi:hypothetical protein